MKILVSILLNYISYLQIKGGNFANSGESWIYGTQKFYIVFAVILIILFGIFAFLFVLERRISKLDHHSKE